MTPITDTEIKQKGMNALIDVLGEVNAERFIVLINREPFDYTEWQRQLFNNMSLEEMSRKAMQFRESDNAK